MKVYKSCNEFVPVKNAVVTLGTFDGVHIGHQKIINRIKELAVAAQGETVIFTFFPHPRAVLEPGNHDLKLINTLDEKTTLLEKLGVDNLIIQPFTKEFSLLNAEEFVEEILVGKLNVKTLVIGYNHQFGRNREGNLDLLKKLALKHNFNVEEIPKQDVDSIAVSSTQIRNALLEGDIERANTCSVNKFTLSGVVVQGKQLGRTIGFPTANIHVLEPSKIIPGNGVYAVKVIVGKKEYGGMLNIGKRPTVNGILRTVEVHILNFDSNIYDEKITVIFIARIRDERKFDSFDLLKAQLFKDKDATIKLLS